MQVPGARVHRPPLRRRRAHYSRRGGGEERERWGGGVAARAARPRSRVPSASLAPGTRSCRAPPTPRPRSAPLPGPCGPRALPGARRPPSRTPTAEPAADSRVRRRSPAPRRPAQLSRLLTDGARALRGRGSAAAAELRNSLRDPIPRLGADGASAPMSTRPLSCPKPRQALPGERGRAGFWHRNCSRAGVARPPGRGGASEPGARPRTPC